MREIVSANPFRCRIWNEHVRLEENLSEIHCEEEIRSLQAHGQLIPAIGRRAQNDSLYDYEVVCGARRLIAARSLNVPLRMELRELPDREAAMVLDIENNCREDLSPYERARGYARWLQRGLFASQDDLAHAMQISKAQLSRLLSLARLPSVIVSAFASPRDICETWGPELYAAWRDPHTQPAMAETARYIAQLRPHPTSSETYEALLTGKTSAVKRALRGRDHIVKDAQGKPLFRVRFRRQTAAILIPEAVMSQAFDKITTALVDALNGAAVDSPSARRPAAAPRSIANEQHIAALPAA